MNWQQGRYQRAAPPTERPPGLARTQSAPQFAHIRSARPLGAMPAPATHAPAPQPAQRWPGGSGRSPTPQPPTQRGPRVDPRYGRARPRYGGMTRGQIAQPPGRRGPAVPSQPPVRRGRQMRPLTPGAQVTRTPAQPAPAPATRAYAPAQWPGAQAPRGGVQARPLGVAGAKDLQASRGRLETRLHQGQRPWFSSLSQGRFERQPTPAPQARTRWSPEDRQTQPYQPGISRTTQHRYLD